MSQSAVPEGGPAASVATPPTTAVTKTKSCLRVLTPLYEWEPTDSERVTLDESAEYIVHQTADGLYLQPATCWSDVDGKVGLFIQYPDMPFADSVKITSDLQYMAVLHTSSSRDGSSAEDDAVDTPELWIFHTAHPNEEYRIQVPAFRMTNFPLSFTRTTATPLAIFWLPASTGMSAADATANGAPSVESYYLAVVCTHGVELFMLSANHMTVRSVRKFVVDASYAWWMAATGYVVLLSNDSRSLVPLHLDPKNSTRMQKIQMHLAKSQKIESCDVSVLVLNQQTYCIHMDVLSGRVSLRCLSDDRHEADVVLDCGAPGLFKISTHDDLLAVHRPDKRLTYLFDLAARGIVVDVPGGRPKPNGAAPTSVRTAGQRSRVVSPSIEPFDAHNYTATATGTASTADVPNRAGDVPNEVAEDDRLIDARPAGWRPRHGAGSRGAMTDDDFVLEDEARRVAVAAESKTLAKIANRVDLYVSGARFAAGNVLMWNESGTFYPPAPPVTVTETRDPYHARFGYSAMTRVVLDKDRITREMAATDKEETVRMLMRRRRCKRRVIDTLYAAAREQQCLTSIAVMFAVINNVYRRTIENVPSAMRSLRKTSRTSAATNNRLEVSFSTLLESSADATLLTEADVIEGVFLPLLQEEWQTDFTGTQGLMDFAVRRLNSRAHGWDVDRQPPQECTGENPYALSLILQYAQSLALVSIMPHRSVTLLLFETCVLYGKGLLLQQLLQYHIVTDCHGLLSRVYWLYNEFSRHDYPWIEQTCLDLAFREKNWKTVVEIYLNRKRYLEVVPLLRRYNVVTYRLSDFLKRVGEDIASQEADPELFPRILDSISHWLGEVCGPSLEVHCAVAADPPPVEADEDSLQSRVQFSDSTTVASAIGAAASLSSQVSLSGLRPLGSRLLGNSDLLVTDDDNRKDEAGRHNTELVPDLTNCEQWFPALRLTTKS